MSPLLKCPLHSQQLPIANIIIAFRRRKFSGKEGTWLHQGTIRIPLRQNNPCPNLRSVNLNLKGKRNIRLKQDRGRSKSVFKFPKGLNSLRGPISDISAFLRQIGLGFLGCVIWVVVLLEDEMTTHLKIVDGGAEVLGQNLQIDRRKASNSAAMYCKITAGADRIEELDYIQLSYGKLNPKTCKSLHFSSGRNDGERCQEKINTSIKCLEKHENESSFWSCVRSSLFWWHLIWLSLMQLRHYLFIGTLNPTITRLSDGDQHLVSKYTNVFAISQFFGVLCAPWNGLIMDRHKRENIKVLTFFIT
ncbi:unnamed protein product [Ranitomeya imitator]|uniref:Uncharacterized protein n=1 Tax=Ranitomeya imitator TaxID=111125 RepID=A0ABN9MMI8_9NEOB|nr:unnamed protein product [Ranitomeya imitator]